MLGEVNAVASGVCMEQKRVAVRAEVLPDGYE